MKQYLHRLILILLLSVGAKASAQQAYAIYGTVTDSLGVPQKSATVFISGTTRVTISDDKGEFKFEQIQPGTFQLSVSMVGFNPYARNMVIQNGSVNVKVVLKTKIVTLREVIIGSDGREYNMNLFKMAFLGMTENAKQCELHNPDAINFYFNEKTRVLTADADELLIIENKRLGYRVKYLLKAFRLDGETGVVLYDGETSFEELTGTETMKRNWAKNRLASYNGSMMQFLRAVYHHTTAQQGYVGYKLYHESGIIRKKNMTQFRYLLNDTPVDFDEITKPVDGALIAMKFDRLYIEYAGAKKTKLNGKPTGAPHMMDVEQGKYGSGLRLITSQAVIDSRGSDTDYKTFYLHGYMAEKRVGDQLPFEYQPPSIK